MTEPLVETPRSNIANALQAIVGFWGTTHSVEREAAEHAVTVLRAVERRLRAALEQLDNLARSTHDAKERDVTARMYGMGKET